MKHREDRQKYFAARRIFNSRLASVFYEGREVNKKKRLNFFFLISRLQNSPYFCVFKYAGAVWNEAENIERDLGRDALSPHTPVGRVLTNWTRRV